MALRLWALLVILWQAWATYAQTTKIQPLSIGDTIPADLVINNVYNYPASKIRLSDLKGKLVILDFWATWCASCIKSIPKVEELQKQFKDEVSIIMINSDTAEDANKVSNFFQRLSQRISLKLTLPYAVKNVILNNYFPQSELPHYVWLNDRGKVIGVTGAEEITAENITAMLQIPGKILFTKRDDLRFNSRKPLLIDENGGDDPAGFTYRSILTGYKHNLGAISGQENEEGVGVKRLFTLNTPLVALIRKAYPEIFKHYGTDRILVEAANYSREILLDPIENKKPGNRFCYEIITRPVLKTELNKYIQEDIRRYFGLVALNDVRPIDCIILTKGSQKQVLQTKGGKSGMDVRKSTLTKHITNEPVQTLADFLRTLLSTPVINETGIDYNIDISFPSPINSYNYSQLKDFLKSKGLQLTAAKRDLEVVIITDQSTIQKN